jgi:4,5-DOPA dioxygenase extradiol
MMRFPAVFVNHGGGPMPLLGKQPELVDQMKEIVQKHLPQQLPKAIVILSAHWESDPIKITSAERPSMYYDYGGFPPETYEYQYPAPGSPELAKKIQGLLGGQGLKSELDGKRGFDHGVFVPLMIMYPKVRAEPFIVVTKIFRLPLFLTVFISICRQISQ